ncbi:MAG: transcriptional regulator, IclR family [Clostridia bacterium]|jgi:DNA-binding IclR family transcriptional regulator|nr:transcriptional regulator, IclR family [Clostridia bacterium]
MSTIQSVDRTFEILEILASEPRGLHIADLVQRTYMNKSTIHRILKTLSEWGYVEQKADKSYRLGVKIVDLSRMYLNNLQLRTEALPYLEELRDKTQLTVHLGIMEDGEVIYIDKLNTSNNFRMYSKIGKRVNAHSTSLGRSMMSYMETEDIKEIVKKRGLAPATKKTLRTEEELFAELEKIKSRGYAIDDEENEDGVRCVAAPIFDYTGQIIAAVSATAFIESLPYERIPSVAESVVSCANNISRRMGYNI